MPRISLSAVVRDRINGANGLVPSNGFPLGQQLETVKAGHLPPQLTCRGIDQKICKQLLYLRRTGHRAAQASSTPRLRGAMPGSWRHRRLRAHFRLLTQMPIAAPVNFSGGQVSRNNTNSEIGRTDGLRTLLRHTACKVRWNVAFSYTKGTVRHCLLGNITENEPREATGPRRRLAMACVSSEMGHPRKNNQKKTTNPDGNRFTRHAPCPETELASGVDGCVLEAPVSSAYRFARERIVVPLGSSDSESEWHEPEPGANGRRHLCVADGVWLCFLSPMFPHGVRQSFHSLMLLQFLRSAHSNGRLKGPGAATIPDECRTRTRSTSIIPTGNGIA